MDLWWLWALVAIAAISLLGSRFLEWWERLEADHDRRMQDAMWEQYDREKDEQP